VSEIDKLDRIQARESVRALRRRLLKAEAGGQVELHLGLGDVELLVSLSEALFEILERVSRVKAQ